MSDKDFGLVCQKVAETKTPEIVQCQNQINTNHIHTYHTICQQIFRAINGLI
jgi:hypothetical protein